MDFQVIGLIFAVIGVLATFVWFAYLRRGVRAVERASSAIEDLRDREVGHSSGESKKA